MDKTVAMSCQMGFVEYSDSTEWASWCSSSEERPKITWLEEHLSKSRRLSAAR